MTAPQDPNAFGEIHPAADPNRDRPAYDADDDFDDIILRRTPFPPMMLAAGILWILSGVLFFLLIALTVFFGERFNIVWLLIGGVFFLKDGIQLLRGAFRDPKIDGIFCIGIAAWILFQTANRYHAGGGLFALAFGLVFTSLILIPGILVLIGRKQYLAWQAERDRAVLSEDAFHRQ